MLPFLPPARLSSPLLGRQGYPWGCASSSQRSPDPSALPCKPVVRRPADLIAAITLWNSCHYSAALMAKLVPGVYRNGSMASRRRWLRTYCVCLTAITERNGSQLLSNRPSGSRGQHCSFPTAHCPQPADSPLRGRHPLSRLGWLTASSHLSPPWVPVATMSTACPIIAVVRTLRMAAPLQACPISVF